MSENTIATGVVGLWAGGAQALAVLILFTTILAPALRIVGLLYVVLPLSLGWVPPRVAGAVRFQEGLVSWAMLDVYMLALLVTLVKLAQMAGLKLEMGAWCFVALFIMLTLVSRVLAAGIKSHGHSGCQRGGLGDVGASGFVSGRVSASRRRSYQSAPSG